MKKPRMYRNKIIRLYRNNVFAGDGLLTCLKNDDGLSLKDAKIRDCSAVFLSDVEKNEMIYQMIESRLVNNPEYNGKQNFVIIDSDEISDEISWTILSFRGY